MDANAHQHVANIAEAIIETDDNVRYADSPGTAPTDSTFKG